MKYCTHNEYGEVDINGTSYVGNLSISYDRLVEILGKPLPGDGYKTEAEWHIKFTSGEVATIYNWKNSRAYMGEYGSSVELVMNWHVGGHSDDVLQKVRDILFVDITGQSTRLPLP